MIKFIKNAKAFSLVEVAVATAVLSTVGIGVFQISQIGSKETLKYNLSRLALDRRGQIEKSIKNSVAWSKSVNSNSSFACFNSGSGCHLNPADPTGFYDFIVFNSDTELGSKKLTFDPTDYTTRLGLFTLECPAGVTQVDQKCPLKYVAKWKPICAAGTYPCQDAQVEIQIKLIHDFPESFPFNASKFDLNIVRSYKDNSIQSVCLSMNGVFNSTTGTCVPKYAGRTCALNNEPHQIISSVSQEGVINCKPLYSGLCGPGEIMGSISSNGVAQCIPRPANPPSCI